MLATRLKGVPGSPFNGRPLATGPGHLAIYQQPVTDRQRRRFAAMKCVSLLRETLWSIVSEIHSTLEFDYVNYTSKNLTRLEQAYEAFGQMH
jgi:hypothetical protein